MKDAVSELMSQCDATKDKIYWNVETKTFLKRSLN